MACKMLARALFFTGLPVGRKRKWVSFWREKIVDDRVKKTSFFDFPMIYSCFYNYQGKHWWLCQVALLRISAKLINSEILYICVCVGLMVRGNSRQKKIQGILRNANEWKYEDWFYRDRLFRQSKYGETQREDQWQLFVCFTNHPWLACWKSNQELS